MLPPRQKRRGPSASPTCRLISAIMRSRTCWWAYSKSTIRRQFEIHAVSLQPEDRTSEVGRRLRTAVEHYHDVSARSDTAAVELLRDHSIDIAVDLNGYTVGGRPQIFAYRCAPVQVSYLGYAGTTGAPYMDYLLADEMVIPPGEEACYSEQIVRLPHCYLPNDDRREIGRHPPGRKPACPSTGWCSARSPTPTRSPRRCSRSGCGCLRENPGSVLWLRARGSGGAAQSAARSPGARSRSAAAGICPARREHGGAPGPADAGGFVPGHLAVQRSLDRLRCVVGGGAGFDVHGAQLCQPGGGERAARRWDCRS